MLSDIFGVPPPTTKPIPLRAQCLYLVGYNVLPDWTLVYCHEPGSLSFIFCSGVQNTPNWGVYHNVQRVDQVETMSVAIYRLCDEGVDITLDEVMAAARNACTFTGPAIRKDVEKVTFFRALRELSDNYKLGTKIAFPNYKEEDLCDGFWWDLNRDALRHKNAVELAGESLPAMVAIPKIRWWGGVFDPSSSAAQQRTTRALSSVGQLPSQEPYSRGRRR